MSSVTAANEVAIYLMSPPHPTWRLRGKANFRSAAAAAVDPRAALGEWIALADAIAARGGRVVCLSAGSDLTGPERPAQTAAQDVPGPPDWSELTGLPYAAECGQIVPWGDEYRFLLPNMSAPHRRGERWLWRLVAERMGLHPVELDGVWEAQGDVATFAGRTLLFFGGRTDRAGVDSAARYFPSDALLLEIAQPAFHGNMAFLPLDAVGKALVCPEVFVGDSFARLERAFGAQALVKVSVDEVRCYATNGLPMGHEVLVTHLLPRRIGALLAAWGLDPVVLPMVELCEKGGGAARCLVSQAWVDPLRVGIPAGLDYRLQRDRILAHVSR